MTYVILGLLIAAVLLGGYLFAAMESVVKERAGRLLLFGSLLLLPASVGFLGFNQSLKAATHNDFCNQCHEMDPYFQSLYIDDSEVLPAIHFQNRSVGRDDSCYTCHQNYTMFGGVKSKITGVKHVWVHFVGDVPEKIELYEPYPNTNCMHCHDGARSFLESKHHRTEDAPLADIQSGKVSCIGSGCHDLGHLVDELEDLDRWNPGGGS